MVINIKEIIKFAHGSIRISRIPGDWNEEEYRYWWLPETDGRGKIVRPARMSMQEKARYQEVEIDNQIMQAGRAAVLTYIGSSSGSSVQWAQYFAIGPGAISGITPLDSALSNEVFRKAQTSYSVNGTTVDINFQLGSSDAQVTMTNAVLWGNGASG